MNRRRLVSFLVLLLVGLIFASPSGAQFWQKKESAKWSASECKGLLRQSPWANEYKIAKVVMEALRGTTAGGLPAEPTVEGRDQPHVSYRAVFLSAKPVRQAMMRLQQLDPKYAKMDPAEQKAFEERAQKFIDTDFSDQVVIQLSYTTVAAYSLPLARYWQTKPQDELRKIFVLITPAGRLEADQVVVEFGGQGGVGQFQLIFPRRVSGQPIAAKESHQLNLEFLHPAIDPSAKVTQEETVTSANRRGVTTDAVLPSERVFIQFKAKGMMLNGELVY